MTGRQLVDEMVEECRSERTRVEDFLNALKDIVVDRLLKSESVVIKGLGSFERVKGRERPFRFHFAKDLYPVLGINSKIHLERCDKCGAEPPLPGRKIGRKCESEKQRQYRKQRRQAAVNNGGKR